MDLPKILNYLYKKKENYYQNQYPYRLNPSLFTASERAFLKVLDEAVGREYRIFGKIRLADVFDIVTNDGNNQGWFNKISQKHFDYVLCDKNDLSFIAAIELNDRSHLKPNRRNRDIIVNDICKAASLPMIWIPIQRHYSVTQIRELIFSKLNIKSSASDIQNSADTSDHERWKPGYAQEKGWKNIPKPSSIRKPNPVQQGGWKFEPAQKSNRHSTNEQKPTFDSYKPIHRRKKNSITYNTLKALCFLVVLFVGVSFALYQFEQAMLAMQTLGKNTASPSAVSMPKTTNSYQQNNDSYNRPSPSPQSNNFDSQGYDRRVRREQLKREQNRLRDAVATASQTCKFWKEHIRKNPKDTGAKAFRTAACNRLNSLQKDYNNIALKLVGY